MPTTPEEAGVGSVNWRKRGRRYQVSWRLDDGAQGSKTVTSPAQARELAAAKRLEIASGAWKGRQRGRLPFDRWADDWWATWSTDPTLSPNTLTMTDSRLRNHLRPFFGSRAIEDITPRLLRQWQHQLASRLGHATVMSCRSVLWRILQFAEDENAIPANPMRKVAAPKRPLDPELMLGNGKRRVLTPEEAGVLLAAFPPFWWDHILTLLGCGLRIGELAGLRVGRVDLARGVLQVVDTRYQAGPRFGNGFKGPKSAAGVRELPLARQVAEAIARQLPPGRDPKALVFTGPGNAGGRPGGSRPARTVLSRTNFHRLYAEALARTADPAATLALGPTDRRLLKTLRAPRPDAATGGQPLDALVEQLAGTGRRLRPTTVAASLARLEAGGLVTRSQAHAGTHGHRGWAAVPPQPGPLAHLRLGGPHDLRHTFATWLEDAGIPARVIDELMGHASGRRVEQGSQIGRVYRETTPEMLARVVAVLEQRLAVVLTIATSTRGQMS
jgi:integrase